MAAVQSPSYESDYKEMLLSMQVANLHSSAAPVERSPAARNLGLRESDDGGIFCSPSPPLSDFLVFGDSPLKRSEVRWSLSPCSPAPPPSSPVRRAKPKNLSNVFGLHIEQQAPPPPPLQSVAESGSTTESESGSDEQDDLALDLNATYSMKTMTRRKLSLMLDALDEDEDEEQQPKAKSPNFERPTVAPAKKTRALPRSDYLKPSPRTPLNSAPLLPERSFRLCNYARRTRASHYAGTAHPVKEQPKIVEWGSRVKE